MSDQIILRIYSKAGRSRVEMSKSATLGDLKLELLKRLQIDPKSAQLFMDAAFRKPLGGRDSSSLSALKLSNGDIIHVANQDAAMTSVQHVAPQKVVSSNEEMIDTSGSSKPSEQPQYRQQKVMSEEQYQKSRCKHPEGQKCVNCLGVTKDNYKDIKEKCNHQPGQKCPNCLEENIGEFKHESFDNYLSEMRKKCAKAHANTAKCQNCTFSQEFNYKVDYTCKNHPPFPKGMCNKCVPPAVVLTRQIYRHVDYVSFMNFKELNGFVNHWKRQGLLEQRMGWLYGYYSEDPNYPMGVRINVEAVYEPPQIGEMNGVQELDDPKRHVVDMLAHSLGLERIGWIMTKIDQDNFLTSEQARKAARFQQEHVFDHPLGFKVSKFVTVVVQPEGDDVGIHCYMISDQGQALERDNIFGESESRKLLQVREPNENEMVPAIVTQGKNVKQFEPDFFLVSVAHGQPAHGRDYNVLKIHEFPVVNRDRPATPAEFKGYLRKYKAEPTQRRFANFQLLLYIADRLDIDTAMTIASAVEAEQPLDGALVELLEAL